MGRMSSNMEKQGGGGGQISEISAESLITQGEKPNNETYQTSTRISAGDPLSKGPLASYKRKYMGKISGNIASLWEIVKNDSPVYQKERERVPGHYEGREGDVAQKPFTKVLAARVSRRV